MQTGVVFESPSDAAPIPADMSPTIDKVKADLKGIGDCSGGGRKSLEQRSVSSEIRRARKRMVVFGDSHSTMWVPSLAADSKKTHWQFFPVVKEACGYHDYTGHGECGAWYAWAKKTIRTLHPDLIVMSV